jgi:hypothetical protein
MTKHLVSLRQQLDLGVTEAEYAVRKHSLRALAGKKIPEGVLHLDLLKGDSTSFVKEKSSGKFNLGACPFQASSQKLQVRPSCIVTKAISLNLSSKCSKSCH